MAEPGFEPPGPSADRASTRTVHSATEANEWLWGIVMMKARTLKAMTQPPCGVSHSLPRRQPMQTEVEEWHYATTSILPITNHVYPIELRALYRRMYITSDRKSLHRTVERFVSSDVMFSLSIQMVTTVSEYLISVAVISASVSRCGHRELHC